jgi:hypothetical protein
MAFNLPINYSIAPNFSLGKRTQEIRSPGPLMLALIANPEKQTPTLPRPRTWIHPITADA